MRVPLEVGAAGRILAEHFDPDDLYWAMVDVRRRGIVAAHEHDNQGRPCAPGMESADLENQPPTLLLNLPLLIDNVTR